MTSNARRKDDSEFYYPTDDAREKLKTYSYNGNDNSLLYHYVLAPLATFLVNTIVPKSMAPNTLTSIGLVFMITVDPGSTAGVSFTFEVIVFRDDVFMFSNIKIFELWDDC